MSKRHEAKRAAREAEQAAKPCAMTWGQVNDIMLDTYRKGMAFGIEKATSACINAYGVVLVENKHMTVDDARKVYEEVATEVFRVLADDEITLDDLPEFARRCGITCPT